MAAWWREFARALYADELGDAFRANWAARAVFTGQRAFRPAALVRRRAHAAGGKLRAPADRFAGKRARGSQEPLRQRLRNWGQAHVARHRHRPFTARALARALLRHPRAERRRRLHRERRRAWTSTATPSRSPTAMRPACGRSCDLADPQASVFIHSGGQSGHPLSSHYSNFAAPWARGEYVPMVTERRRVEADGVQRLVLVPRK